MANAWWMQTQRVTTAAIEAAERFAAKEAALDALIAAGPGGGANYVWRATALLDNDQIPALPATPVAIGAAPGEGRVIVPVAGSVRLVTATGGGYSGIDAGFADLYLTINAAMMANVWINRGAQSLADLTTALSASNQTTRAFLTFGSAQQGATLAAVASLQAHTSLPIQGVDFVNQGLDIRGYDDSDDNWDGGNAANAMRVVVAYLVQDESTGELVAAA